MSNKPTICVIGSINMDLTINTNKMPAQGETVLGKNFAQYPGGKGANQAVSAARLGANVHMIGAVGSDAFGDTLLSHLASEQINVEGIKVSEYPTGVATIILSENDNRIIVSPGSNELVSPDLVETHKQMIKNSNVVLIQLEIPIETVKYAVKVAHEFEVPVVLNPAPYQRLSKDLFNNVTYLTPNEIELKEMQNDTDIDSIKEKLIITKGDKGVQYYSKHTLSNVSGFQVEVKDTTGAGDTFNGAFAMQLANDASIHESVLFANAAAALSITKAGAQKGMPTNEEVEKFMKERGVLH
ncbi:ribokinase [Virgibacillus dakarensis]|uniref:ribokinase n=1 Tax=Virgibacillus dakarensis TaxID=1917889 RepID=UPI000B437E51|nr:ribokinase [Virgibacillus dakarensis]